MISVRFFFYYLFFSVSSGRQKEFSIWNVVSRANRLNGLSLFQKFIVMKSYDATTSFMYIA